jgi:hypothetical protein
MTPRGGNRGGNRASRGVFPLCCIRQRFQQLFFPDGIAFDGNRFVRTAVTAPAFSYWRPIESGNEGLVDQTGIEPVTS